MENREIFLASSCNDYCIAKIIPNMQRFCHGYVIFFEKNKITFVNIEDDNLRNDIFSISEHFPLDILGREIAGEYVICFELQTFENIKNIEEFIEAIFAPHFENVPLEKVTLAEFYDKCLEETNMLRLKL